MKKLKYLVVSLISIFVFSSNAFAASAGINVSSNNVYVGDTFTVYVNMTSAAAWNLHTVASGPVSGCIVNEADSTADAMDTSKTFSATCTATGVGTITISLNGDVTSSSDENTVNVGGSTTVNVSTRPSPTPTPDPTPSPTPSPTPGNNNNNNNNNNSNNNNKNNNTNNNNNGTTTSKSDNNKLKDISVEGYDLVKVDDNNYTLEVDSDVTSINIKATLEEETAKITGDGKRTIDSLDNTLELVITSESGKENKIVIKVTKKDGYYIEDLDKALKKNTVNITLKDNTNISSSDLDKIKKSGKVVNFNYYNDDKKLIYSLIVDGSKIKSTSGIDTSIKFNSSNKNDILRLSNYADGLFLGLSKVTDLSNGIKIKLYVGDKFNNGDIVNVYGYMKGNDALSLVKSKLKVSNGYITFDGINASDYLVTTSNIALGDEEKDNSDSSLIPYIIGAILGLLVIILIIIFIVKRNKNKDKKNSGGNGTMQDNNLNNNGDNIHEAYNNSLNDEFSNLVNSNINYNNNNMNAYNNINNVNTIDGSMNNNNNNN